MSTYKPDRWKVLRFDMDGQKIDKVFAGWGGSYTYGASWKLSSGITETIEHEDHYEFVNHSGSVYTCYKHSEGMTGYQMQVFSGFTKQVEESEGKATMEVIDYDRKEG